MSFEEQILNLVKEADPANPVEYVQSIVKPLARQKLDSYIMGCSDCDTCRSTKSITHGNVNAAIMIIGESVLEEQVGDEAVHPFVGTAEGALLDKLLDAYHVNRDELFWINAVNCFTYKEVNGKQLKRAPSKTEVEGCRVFLEYAIDVIKPVAIILLGNVALNMFHKNAITQARGQWVDVRGIPAMPTYHPSYLLHLEGKKDPDLVEIDKGDFCEDVLQVLLRIQKDFPDNNVLLEKLEEE